MRRIVYRDVPLYSRRRFYPIAQGNVPAWWVKKRKPTRVSAPVYKHKRTKSAYFIPNVAPPVFVFTPKRKPHLAVRPPPYRHKRSRSAYFVPDVPPPPVNAVNQVIRQRRFVQLNAGKH